VFFANSDPVRESLVASLNRPGGNATGVIIFGAASVTKRVQLLHELVPQAAIAYLMNPNNPSGDVEMSAAQAAARSLGRKMLVLRASSEREFDTAFATMAEQRAAALLVASDVFFLGRRHLLVSLAARHRIPAIYYLRAFAEAGGLMTYGNTLLDMYHQVCVYVGRILNGTKPADLPVIQSTKFELVINLKTAKALGLALPGSLLIQADQVIE
jgi:putative ABC transport system substrate-binding protein